MDPDSWPENSPLKVVVVPCAWCDTPTTTTNANVARHTYNVLCEACHREQARQWSRDYYQRNRAAILTRRRARYRELKSSATP